LSNRASCEHFTLAARPRVSLFRRTVPGGGIRLIPARSILNARPSFDGSSNALAAEVASCQSRADGHPELGWHRPRGDIGPP
jgi:hypothetical protein